MFAAISSLAICGCRTIVKENNKTDNINRYFWIPSSSGTVQHPIEVFDVHFCYYRPKEGNTYLFQYNYFGYFLKNGGLASGTNGIVYDENTTGYDYYDKEGKLKKVHSNALATQILRKIRF